MSDDVQALTSLNERFIEACRQGSWELLEPVLAPTFRYLDGATGQLWEPSRYIADVRQAQPSLQIDELVIHIDQDTALVSARSSSQPGRSNRYLDVYRRSDSGWHCTAACVWPLV